MTTLTLTEEEYELLAAVVDESLRELRDEIRETDSFDYRSLLRAREAGLAELAARLRRGHIIPAN